MKFDTRTVLWSLLKYIGSGIVIMWLTFWYISGSFWGLPRLFVAYYAASQVFMTPMSKATLYDGMLKGLIGSLGEPHSVYLDADEFKSMKMQTSGTYAGVGMVLGHDDKGLYAVSVMEDQPAFKAGIKPGDHIIAIDGQSTSDITVEDASSRIRGEAGTVVALDIERNGETLHFDITRESIVLPTVKSKMLTSTVGYIRISQFAENTADDFGTQFKELQSQGMKELILDLRDNPGGLLSTTEKISNYIMPPGTLVTVQNRAGKKDVYKSNGPEVAMPLVVLVNKGSASASEIIAGAIQDRKLGTILGTNTYGKGTVQTIYPSLDNEGVKVTIAKYHTPNDRVIDGIGIKPGDHIIAIDGQSTSDITVEDASSRIRGEAGTVVALDIERNGETLHFDITRESIVLPTVKSKMLTSTVGYIRISQFAENTADDFETQFKELQSQGMKELVLDLRDNPGGLLSTTEKISNYIMPPGTLVTVQNRAGKKDVYKSNGPEVAMPLVVLVNKGSASASEIIAGAIQDRKLGTILGTNTYGKGTVQTIYPSLDNEGVKVTIAKYHTPNDRVIDGIGIKPDVELDLPKGVNPSSTVDDIQIKKALELLQH